MTTHDDDLSPFGHLLAAVLFNAYCQIDPPTAWMVIAYDPTVMPAKFRQTFYGPYPDEPTALLAKERLISNLSVDLPEIVVSYAPVHSDHCDPA